MELRGVSTSLSGERRSPERENSPGRFPSTSSDHRAFPDGKRHAARRARHAATGISHFIDPA